MSLGLSLFLGLWALLLLAHGWKRRALQYGLKLAVHLGDADAIDGWVALTADGVVLDEGLRARAIAAADAQGLDLVDLIPEGLPSADIRAILGLIDGDAGPLAPGRSAAHALIIRRDVWDRAALNMPPTRPAIALAAAFKTLRRYAPRTTGRVILPGLSAQPSTTESRRALSVAILNEALVPAYALNLVVIGLHILAPLFWWPFGLAIPITWHVQATLAGSGPLKARHPFVPLIAGLPIELWRWATTVFGPWPDPQAQAREARRPFYDAAFKDGPDRLFGERRTTCPDCGGAALSRRTRTFDTLQSKPGRFTLDRCRDCRHTFQNPAATDEGLGVYYGDFYAGLGAARLEAAFAMSESTYMNRADAALARFPSDSEGAPVDLNRWLDVGGGHGHFALVLGGRFPELPIDLLDLGDTPAEAERRGWVATGHEGPFVETAKGLEGAYDIVSMSHYLEHTRDPDAELAAAAHCLRPGGVIFVEVPNPETFLARIAGPLWLPWLQPQHLHFVPPTRMETRLERAGFTDVRIDRKSAHEPLELTFIVLAIARVLGPAPGDPWAPRRGLGARVRHHTITLLSLPLVIVAQILDRLIAPVAQSLGHGNAYRATAIRPHRAVDEPGSS